MKAVNVFVFIACALFWCVTFFPPIVSSDACEFLWQAQTGNIDDYRSWVFGFASHLIFNLFNSTNAIIVIWYAAVIASIYTASKRLGTWRSLLFSTILFCPLFIAPYQLVMFGNDTMFAAIMLLGVSSWATKGTCPAWFGAASVALRPNALPLSIISVVFVKRWWKIVTVALLLLAICPPANVSHIPVSNEFMSMDAIRYKTGNPNFVEIDCQYVYGVPNMRFNNDVPLVENSQGVQDYKQILRNDPLGMIATRLKSFAGFFDLSGKTWIYVNGNWRGIHYETKGALAKKLASFGLNEKPWYISIWSSAYAVVVLSIIGIIKHRIVWSLIPLAYFSTFLVATMYHTPFYWFPSLLSALWIVLLKKGSNETTT